MNYQTSNLSLLNLVKKQANTKEGLFLNIYTDIDNSVFPFDLPDLLIMSSAYALRSLAAGLYLQGVIDLVGYEKNSQMFHHAQLSTCRAVEFQEMAAFQSNELLYSYDKRLTPIVISFLATLVEINSDKVYRPSSPVSYEVVLYSVMRASSNFLQ